MPSIKLMVQCSRYCTSCWHSKVLGSNPIHDQIFLRVNGSFSKYIDWTFQNMPIKDKMIRSLRNQGKYSQYVHNLAPEWSGHCFNLFKVPGLKFESTRPFWLLVQVFLSLACNFSSSNSLSSALHSVLFYSMFHMELDLSIQRFLVQIPFMLNYFHGSTCQMQSGRDHPKHADQINDNTQQRNQAQNSTNGHNHLTPEWSRHCFCFSTFFCFSLFRFRVRTPKTVLIVSSSINIITSLYCFFI